MRPLTRRWRRPGIRAVIPVKDDQENNRRAGGRPPAFEPARYRDRNTVERCFAKLRQFRAVVTRYDSASSSTGAPSMPPRSGSGSATRHEP